LHALLLAREALGTARGGGPHGRDVALLDGPHREAGGTYALGHGDDVELVEADERPQHGPLGGGVDGAQVRERLRRHLADGLTRYQRVDAAARTLPAHLAGVATL